MEEKNKNFIKDNWFKLFVIFSILLIGISLFYNLVILGNKREAHLREESELKKQQDCQRVANELYNDWKKTLKDDADSGPSNPEFYYNPVLKKCLFYGVYINKEDSGVFYESFIKDVYTNESILKRFEYDDFTDDGKNFHMGIETTEEFNIKKKELFNQ